MIYVIFLLPVIYFLVGILMKKYPPKKINYFIGYRTRNSMKNKKNWNLANKYCGDIMIKLGISLFILSFIIFILFILDVFVFTDDIMLIVILFQTFIIFLPIFLVETKIND